MHYFVYVLKSKYDNTHYVGMSDNPERRLQEHNSGAAKYTKGHKPFTLVYKEKFLDRKSARLREKYLKTGHGREDLKKIIPP